MPLFITRVLLFIFIAALSSMHTSAQLCQGSLGDPVVNITFGSGSNPGPALDPGTTSMNFVSNDCPPDGSYTIQSKTFRCFNNTWHSLNSDHTGDPDGYFMLVNASFQPSDFYVNTVKGLCGGTTYEFAAWMANVLVQRNGIRPNITFSIEKLDGTVLQSINSGNIDETPTATWKQYGFFFSTPPDVFEVVLRMRNNAPGGIGNDLALDDITFRPCGALVTASIEGAATDTTLCEGNNQALNFSANISAGYNMPVYQWQIKGSNGAWQDIPNAKGDTYRRLPTAGTGVYQYRLTVSSASNSTRTGCRVASNPVSVTIRPFPTITLVKNGPQCEGTDIKIAGKVDFFAPDSGKLSFFGPGYIGAISENQTKGNGFISFDHIIKNASPANAAKIYLSASSSHGCTRLDSLTPVLHPKPVALFDVPVAGCETVAMNFAGKAPGGAYTISKWSWDFGSGNPVTSQSANHSFSKGGTYPVSLQVETDKNCKSDIATKNIVVHELPQVNFVLPEICIGDPFALFMDSSTGRDNSQQPFSYLWNFDDANNTTEQNTSTLKNPQHKYAAVGNYKVNLRVTSVNGCINDRTKLFTVNGAQPVATFIVNNQAGLCSNEEVVITNGATVDFGSITRIEIFWDAANPSSRMVDENPVRGKQYKHQYAVGSLPQSSVTVRYIAYSGIGCMQETVQEITLNKSPEVVFVPLEAVCEEIAPFMIKATEKWGLAGSGIFSGAGITSDGSFTPAMAKPGVHNLQYVYTTNKGCKDTMVQTIRVHPKPQLNAGADLTVLKGSTVQINASLSGNGATALWSPATYLDNAGIINPRATPLNETLYTVTATSNSGCTSKDDVLVRVVDKLYIPNAFTPDGDGVNDLWTVPYLNSIADMNVTVYNRSGQVVYHTSKNNSGWDGRFNGREQSSGVYVYLVESRQNNLRISGTVVLIR
ncbi:MAG TPA: PKD domain-containing protein [Chitinophagaceae bacterium]|nr:PKD domain-containing protein [Chitinophagaceae bacterium]